MILLLTACAPAPPAVPLVTNGATALDVDGDGYADVLTSNGTDPLVMRGSADGLGAEVTFSRDLGPTTWVGDLNGDGRADLIGSMWASDELHPAWFHGTAGAGFEAGVLYDPRELGVAAGTLHDVGDLTGDGAHELVLFHSGVIGPERHTALWYGGSALDGPPDLWFTETEFPDWATAEVAGQFPQNTGDVDGDGFEDLLIGDRIYYGGPELGARSDAAEEWLPFHMPQLRIGDVDGNGFAELFFTRGGGTRLSVGYAGPAGLRVIDEPQYPLEYFGEDWEAMPEPLWEPNACHQPVGDINGDGRADVLFTQGIRNWPGGREGLLSGPHYQVHAHTFFGTEQELSREPSQSFPPPDEVPARANRPDREPEGELFTDCRGLGDIDGDGYGDVMISIGRWYAVYSGGPQGLRERPTDGWVVNMDNGLVATW